LALLYDKLRIAPIAFDWLELGLPSTEDGTSIEEINAFERILTENQITVVP
jgi:hypothetical protein